MPFDPSTASPVDAEESKFDPSSAEIYEPKGIVASAVDAIGTGMNAVRDWATGKSIDGERPGSVLETPREDDKPFDFKSASATSRKLQDAEDRAAQYGSVKPIVGPKPSVESIATGVASDLVAGGKGARAGINQMVGDAFGSKRSLDQAKKERAQADLMTAVNTPEFESDTAKGIYGGVSSLVRQIPSIAAGIITRNPEVALGGMVAPMLPDEYSKFRERGASPLTALPAAIATTATEYFTEKMPMGVLVNKFGKIGTGKFLAEILAKEVPGEQIATVVQDAIDTATANPNTTWGQYLANRPSAAYQTLVATLTQSALMGGGNALANKGSTKPDPAILGAKSVDEAITAFTDPTNFTATPRGLIGSITNATAGPGFDARSVAGDYIDSKDLADLVQTERKDQQVMLANIQREQADAADSLTAHKAYEASKLEGPTLLGVKLQEALQQTQEPTQPAASTEAVSTSTPEEPRIVERTPYMTPMPKELAELQVDMDGGEVVRILNRNGKYAYAVIKDSNGTNLPASPDPTAPVQPAADVLVPASVVPERVSTDALTKPVEESDQEKSHREWGENYNQVINAPDLTKVDTKSLDRAIGYGESYLGQLKRKGWDGSPVNQTLIDQIQIDVDAINAEAKTRRKATEQSTPAASTQPIGVTSEEADWLQTLFGAESTSRSATPIQTAPASLESSDGNTKSITTGTRTRTRNLGGVHSGRDELGLLSNGQQESGARGGSQDQRSIIQVGGAIAHPRSDQTGEISDGNISRVPVPDDRQRLDNGQGDLGASGDPAKAITPAPTAELAFDHTQNKSGNVTVKGDPAEILAAFTGLKGVTVFADGKPAGIMFTVPDSPAVMEMIKPTLTDANRRLPTPAASTQPIGVTSEEADWLQTLFGAESTSRSATPIQAAKTLDVPTLRTTISTLATDLQTQRDDWASRSYQANGKQVLLNGDGPSNQGSMSVSSINEGKRTKAVQAFDAQLGQLAKLETQLKTPDGAKAFTNLVQSKWNQAQAFKPQSPDQLSGGALFESLMIDALKLQPAQGSYTSLPITKALRATMEASSQQENQNGVKAPQALEAKPIQAQAPAATTFPGSFDYLEGLSKDVGHGFTTNDDAIAIIKDAASGMTPAGKASVTKAINEFTAVQKNGNRLIKPDFYDAISEKFRHVEYMLTDAAKKHFEAQEGSKAPEAAAVDAIEQAKDSNTFTGQASGAGRLVGMTQPKGTPVEKLFSNFADQGQSTDFREKMFQRANADPKQFANDTVNSSTVPMGELSAKIDTTKSGNTRVQVIDGGNVVGSVRVQKGMIDSIAVIESEKGKGIGESLLSFLDKNGIANIYEVPDRSPGFVAIQKKVIGNQQAPAAPVAAIPVTPLQAEIRRIRRQDLPNDQKPDATQEQVDQVNEAEYQQSIKDSIRERLGLIAPEAEKPTASAFRSFLREYGIQKAHAQGVTGERGIKAFQRLPFTFRENGLGLDELALRAQERGYLTQGDIDSDSDNGGTRKLTEMIQDEINGKRQVSSEFANETAESAAESANRAEIESMAGKIGLPYDAGMDTGKLASMVNRVNTRLENPRPTDKFLKPERVRQNAIDTALRIEKKRAEYEAKFNDFAKHNIAEQDALLSVLTDEDGNPTINRKSEIDAQQAWADLHEQDTHTPEYTTTRQAQTPSTGQPEASAGNSEANAPRGQQGSNEVQRAASRGEEGVAPSQDLFGDVPNASQQAAADILAAREKKQKDALANAPAFEGLDMVDSRNGNVVAPGQQEIGQEPTDPLSIADTRQRRAAVIEHLGEGWKASDGIEGSKDMFKKRIGSLDVTIMPQKTVDGNFYFGTYNHDTKQGSNDSTAKTLDEAKTLADKYLAKPADPVAKPASEMSASELLRAAADKMDAEKAPKEVIDKVNDNVVNSESFPGTDWKGRAWDGKRFISDEARDSEMRPGYIGSTKNNAPYENRAGALGRLRADDYKLTDTHEIVQVGKDGYAVRPKEGAYPDYAKTPGAQPAGKIEGGTDKGTAMYSMSPMKSIDANVRRGMESLAKALDEKTTVHRAMFRNGLGWVDFVWGSEGAMKPSGKYKGAMGLSHIIEARQSKDGMSESDSIKLLGDIVDAVANGEEIYRNEVEGNIRIGVEKSGIIAWLAKTKASNAWVVTGYEKNPDGADAGRATSTPTSATASLTRDGRVAGFGEIVANNFRGRNQSVNQGVTNPTTVPALEQAIRELVGKFEGNQLGKIVATTSDKIKSEWVPQVGSVNLESEGNAGKAQAFFDPETKTIFLIADHIEAGTEQAIAAHELMHKWGKEVLGEAGWNRLHSVIDNWYQAKPGTDERRVYDYAADRVNAAGAELNTQELFPYAVEAAIKFGIKPSMQAKQGTVARWLESVRQNLKAVWGKLTSKPESFKAQDMVDLAFAIAQRENFDVGSIADGKSSVLSKDGSFKGWPKFNSWTRSEYNDVVSLLPDEYRNDPHRQEPIPTKDWNVLAASVVPQLDKINEAIGAGTFRLDGLGNIHADARKNAPLLYLSNVMDIADRQGLGIYLTGIPVERIQQLHAMGFVSEMGLGAVLQREARYATGFKNQWSDDKKNNAWAQPPMPMAEGGVNNPAYGTIMSYKPRGFSKVLFSRSVITGQTLPETWQSMDASKMDDFIYSIADKHIDTKRVMKAVRDTIGAIADQQDPYLQEELYHGRSAMAVKEFLEKQVRPLITDLQARGVDMSDFEEYLHNRHAERRNVQVAKVNPAMQDGGSGIKTADARAYLAALPADKARAYTALAAKVDQINRDTRALLVSSGLEKQSTIDAWQAAYGDEYVPLMREEMENGMGIGQGFSVRGSASKRAMGSDKPVANILANIMLAREKAITRSEKRKIGEALYGLVLEAPNPNFWLAIDPALQQNPAQLLATSMQLIDMGMDPADAESIAKEPTTRYINPKTGLVESRINPAMRSAENVLAVRIDGEDKYVFFNKSDERAMRMAKALKNLDADQLGQVMGTVAKMTRYFAAVNTQYNPIFGVTNIIRDVQTAMLNLQSTALKGKQKDVLKNILPALRGIYIDLRDHRAGKQPTSAYAQVFEEFQREGGATGYRDMYANAEERADQIRSEIAAISDGKAMKLGKGVMGWLSDYNEAMENAVRVSAYMAAKEHGMSNQQAASLAKNLTVNFNRKGQVALQAGALYAFFNASVQGSARMGQTLFEGGKLSTVGKQIITGGLLLGAMQAMLLAAAGFDDDEPPDFVRERNIVIPIGGKKYITIPMPLGFHVIPNLARIPTEWAMGGFKNTPKRIGQLFGLLADGLNPIGSSTAIQTLSPTIIDPFVALSENKDWTGKPIAKKDFDSMHPTAGHTRAKDTATPWAKFLSKATNYATGGTEYKPGVLSPTPDQIDYVVGQLTGGVGREISKLAQVGGATIQGDEIPLYKIPLVGRFVGTTDGQAAESSRFYENLKSIGVHKAEIDGLKRDHKGGEIGVYVRDNPEARMLPMATKFQDEVSKLNHRKRELVKQGASAERIKIINMQITARMKQFNDQVRRMEESAK